MPSFSMISPGAAAPTRLQLFGRVDQDMARSVLRARNAESLEILLSTKGGTVADAARVVLVLARLKDRASCTVIGECSSAGLIVLSGVHGRRRAFRSSIFRFHRSSAAGLTPNEHGRLTPHRLVDIAGQLRQESRLTRWEMSARFARGADPSAIATRIAIWESAEATVTAAEMLRFNMLDEVL